MASDPLIRQQRAKLRERFFMLLQQEVPEGFDRKRIETELRELAAGLVLKGSIKNDEWNEALEIKNHDAQLIKIIDLVLKAGDETKDPNPGALMDELTKELAEHKKIEEQKAETKKTQQPSPHQQAEKIIQAQQLAIARLKVSNTEAAEGFEDIQEAVATGLVNNPEKTIPAAIQFVSCVANNPQYTEIEALMNLTPLVTPAQDYSLAIDNLVSQVSLTLPADVPESVKTEVSQSVVAFKLAHPLVTKDEYKPLVEKIELQLAVDNKIALEIPAETIDLATRIEAPTSAEEVIKQTIQVRLQRDGISKEDSQKTAEIITKFAPAIHYVSSFAPSPTPKDYDKNKREITTKLTNHVLDRLLASPGTPRNLLHRLKESTAKFDFYHLYNTAYGPAQFYQYTPDLYEYPTNPNLGVSDPYLSYVLSYGKSYAQDAITGAALDLVVAGPVGAWILPDATLSAAFVFDAGISATPVALAAGATPAVAAAAGSTIPVATAGVTAGGAAATGGTAGAAFGPVGIALGAAAGAIAGWFIANKDKIWNALKNLGVPLLLGGAVFGGLLLTGIGGLLVATLGGGAVAVTSFFMSSQIASVTSVGPSTVLQPIGQFTGHVLANLAEITVVEIAMPIIVIIISIPIVVALLLFIINTSAYVVPPSIGGSFGSSGAPYTGPLPEGCPTEWPLDSSRVTQGAYVPQSVNPGGYHSNTEALDLHATVGTPVKATHTGVVVNKVSPGAGYGNYVDLLSTCSYKGIDLKILSRYAHLNSFALPDSTLVKIGDIIAYSGGSGGYDNAPHLHYEFRRNDLVFSHTHFEEDVAPFMWPNFIPKEVPRGCLNACNVNIP